MWYGGRLKCVSKRVGYVIEKPLSSFLYFPFELLIRTAINLGKSRSICIEFRSDDNWRFKKFGTIGECERFHWFFAYLFSINLFQSFIFNFFRLHETVFHVVWACTEMSLLDCLMIDLASVQQMWIGSMCRQSFGFGPNTTNASRENPTLWWWCRGQCFGDGSARIGDWSEERIQESPQRHQRSATAAERNDSLAAISAA